MAVAAILASFILTLQMYVSARARVVARIRLAYKYTFVMEDAAKMVVLSRIEYFQTACGGANRAVGSILVPGVGNPNSINICLDSGGGGDFRKNCINGEACICNLTFQNTDQLCADQSVNLEREFLPKDKWYNESGDSMYAFNSKVSDPELTPAFDNSIFEMLIPNFDNKLIAFFERVVNKPENKKTSFLMNEAVAAGNVSYQYTIPNPNMYGGTPDTTAVGPSSPYPTAGPSPGGDAYTWRDCGQGRCVEIRVCVALAKEQSLGSLPRVCFTQKISRSFLWNHGAAPCAAAVCLPGGPAPANTPANNDAPASDERGSGTLGCPDCPWRDRF